MAAVLAGALILVLFLVWLVKSVNRIGPQEMGVRVRFGRPIEFVDSGLAFAPFFIDRIIRYRRTVYKIGFQIHKVVTKAGEYKGTEYGAEPISVETTLYLRFPQGKALVETLKVIPVDPENEEGLRQFFEPAVASGFRAVLGMLTWREVIEGRETVKNKVEEYLRAKDSPFKRAKIKDQHIYLAIPEVILPAELEKQLSLPDIKRLEAESAEYEAKIRAIEIVGSFVRMQAEATGKTLEEVRNQLGEDLELQKELLDLLKRRMAIDGKAFFDMRIEGPDGFSSLIAALVAAWKRMPSGGQTPEEKEQVSSPPPPDESAEAEIDVEALPPDEQEVVKEANRRGVDPRKPLERWRNWKQKQQDKRQKRRTK